MIMYQDIESGNILTEKNAINKIYLKAANTFNTWLYEQFTYTHVSGLTISEKNKLFNSYIENLFSKEYKKVGVTIQFLKE